MRSAGRLVRCIGLVIDRFIGLLRLRGGTLLVAELPQQLQRQRRLSKDADRPRPADIHQLHIALEFEDLGDAVDGRQKVDDIAGVGLGDQQLQARLVGAARTHEPFGLPDFRLLLGGARISFDDLRAQQGRKPAPWQAEIARATAASTCMAESRLRCLVAWATLRAFHAGTPPVMISCHSSGNRYRRSSASAIKARANQS